ncbi:glycoside hydrolase family 15 protein [Candidatus Halobonum tyrrellensis]|uniref:Glucoamylase / glycosyl hydrolase n=1 Tax=Candidatus Halobonum tyrrellensis G22 TaxID=1324957 RepID=V4HBN8_9EURY|nr:glycoside hydrolase family 15 protein [Candidatus Halobonum tyrrellensis]ESP88125.1 glucoamylase / glycosyl hydrolase [Candidatus Halobonum tyrrellensis G22]
MRLRTALNEYKRDRAGRSPGREPTITGSFSGHGDRLVHVDPGGYLRDYSSSLSGLYGVDRSRFGVETADRIRWFDDLDSVRQHYYRETNLVETEYDAGKFTVHQYDLTLGRAHVTHVELRGAVPPEARLVAFLTFAPEGQETRVGRLIHEGGGPDGTKAVEVYHRREHDYVTASTGIDEVRGQIPERFDEILDEEPVEFPRHTGRNRYEDAHLSGDVVVTAPLERVGRAARTTLVTQLSDHEELDRETALADLRDCTASHRSADDIRSAARERTTVAVPEGSSRSAVVRADLRALDLLEAPTGAHVSGPEVDPFFTNSGGYGYTWFRGDAAIASALLDADDAFGVDTLDDVTETASFCCDAQLDDGTWPHRVWAVDGTLAPGWANAHVEGDSESMEYQADQTANVTAFLARLLRERRDVLGSSVVAATRESLDAAVAAMDDSLGEDGLPGPCQNVWEDMSGQFAHTAAAFVEAYAAVARAPVGESLAERACESARTVLGGLDGLWVDGRDCYGMRLTPDGELDDRVDAAGFALADAAAEYDAVEGLDLPDATLDRIAAHTETALETLYRDPSGAPVAGLVRYEGDDWRTHGQAGSKVWSLTTAEGVVAAARVGELLTERDDGERGEALLDRASDLYRLLDAEGPLTTGAGYLPEQLFDDGTPDSATPLGQAHAVRLRATALLSELEALPTAASLPEGPTDRPRWTTGEKFGVGTVADHRSDDPSRVWFTLTAGALTEVRFPRIDLMNLRTLDFIVNDPDDERYTVRTHNETRTDDDSDTVTREVTPAADDALLFRQTVAETGDGRGHAWTLDVEYATDPEHDALLADVSFEADDDTEYELFAVADTALANTGTQDRGMRLGSPGSHHLAARDSAAYTGESKEPLLVDDDGEGYSVAVAMAAANRFDWATVGVAGSDALRTLYADGTLPETRETVDDENVVLVGRFAAGRRADETIALGFARHADTAAALGESFGALTRGYETAAAAYADSWREFLADKPLPASVADDEVLANQYRSALMCLRAVEDKTYLGGSIASPSVPWGEAVTAEEPKGYGYNFVWSRDLYQVFTVLDMVGDIETAVDQLEYIYEYQQDDHGFIPQNTYLNGLTRWGGEQMDNISFPQVMAYQLWERGVAFDDTDYGFENVRRSADYVVRNGPATAQERWEEEAGYSPSSIAAEIAGLACAGKLAVETGAEADALVWLALADKWTRGVDDWTATMTGTDLHTETPYYVRVTRDGDPEAGHLRTLANQGPTLDERDIIDGGFLDLVRLGIKPWDDPIVRNSLVEVDRTIRVDTESTAAFYRYNGDGYGERGRDDEGAPWSVEHAGKGRLWPLLSGERGEYELLADADARDDDLVDPAALLTAMQEFANSGRMIAEQVWDRDHATEYNWEYGEGTGSATPLAWSMAQFARLAHGLDEGEPVETPRFVRERYLDRGLADADDRPDLRVHSRFEGDRIVVSGETTGEVVAVKTPTDTALVEPEDGEFEARLRINYGENTITVAAADDRDFETATTALTQITL